MKKVFSAIAPLLLAALLAGCSVSEMSTLRELSRPYTGVYACETLTYAGRDLMGDLVSLRLELGYGGEAVLRWTKAAGGGGERSFSYSADVENDRITFFSGRHKRTFALQEGAIVVDMVVCGRLLYGVFRQ